MRGNFKRLFQFSFFTDADKENLGRAIFQVNEDQGECFKHPVAIPCTQTGLSTDGEVMTITNTQGMEQELTDNDKYEISIYLYNIVKEANLILVTIPLSVANSYYYSTPELKTTFLYLKNNIFPLKSAIKNMMFVVTDRTGIMDEAYIYQNCYYFQKNLNNALHYTVAHWTHLTILPTVPALCFNGNETTKWFQDEFKKEWTKFQNKPTYKFYQTKVFTYSLNERPMSVLLIVFVVLFVIALAVFLSTLAWNLLKKKCIKKENNANLDIGLERN